jgi:adenylosuccinate lyase
MIAQKIVHPKLRKWIHVPLTSCDALDTGRALQYLRAYEQVVKPKMIALVKLFIERINSFAGILQIGRTHGQHAIPITVGFWWANILGRILYNFKKLHLNT